MFEKKELKKEEVYQLRLWLLNLSDRLESRGEDGDKVMFKLGRQCEKLKAEAMAFEDDIKNLRVEYGTLTDKGFEVKEGTSNYKKFEEGLNNLKAEKVEVDFLSRRISEAEMEKVKGISIKDWDFLPYFVD